MSNDNDNADTDCAQERFESLQEIVQKARTVLTKEKWDSLVGGAETETTIKRNRLAIETLAFKPRVLRDVRNIDLSVEQFNRRLPLPVFLAPTGPLNLFEAGGGATAAQAAQHFGVPHMLSSGCTPIEQVAATAPSALRLAQLYVRGDDTFVQEYIRRTITSGCAAICLTVDSPVLARRDRDIANRYRMSGLQSSRGQTYQAGLSWRTVQMIKSEYDLPLILKGIVTAEDACIAADLGVDWIYVSNHGGRQLDHGRGTLEVLPEVVAAASGKARIMIDGGFCRGSDIVKAMAMGADLVGLGRMQCYAIAAGGEAAIVRMLEILEDEIYRTMALLGVSTFSELDNSYISATTPVLTPGTLSAFPLNDWNTTQ
ncbi:alpha-hydroxy-acid oxidizing protein [Rhizobium leguminosarum]|uniref:alpha-hydroxy acid oxidase n=1 Tax=Rhizobium leguminosarum TaxID=384 RepID=UPI001C9628E6|nr:alpha-hydroxy acid oxidase [Rhizobium leguminosarum]MBY5774199.1 alpha-hydroxy-acid oxidizing protein [Rhizobium leguminosarum]